MENLRRDSSKSGKKDVEKLKRLQHSSNRLLPIYEIRIFVNVCYFKIPQDFSISLYT